MDVAVPLAAKPNRTILDISHEDSCSVSIQMGKSVARYCVAMCIATKCSGLLPGYNAGRPLLWGGNVGRALADRLAAGGVTAHSLLTENFVALAILGAAAEPLLR